MSLGTGLGFAPPFLAGVCGGCGWAWALACTPPFLARVLGRVWLWARSACNPPFLARVCGVGVCAWVRVSAAPRHSWLGCWGLCVFVCALRLYPATPGWGERCGCVSLGSGLGCAPPLLAGVLGCVCVFVCALRLYPTTPGPGAGLCVLVCTLRLYPATPVPCRAWKGNVHECASVSTPSGLSEPKADHASCPTQQEQRIPVQVHTSLVTI